MHLSAPPLLRRLLCFAPAAIVRVPGDLFLMQGLSLQIMSRKKIPGYVVIPGAFDASWVSRMTELYEAELRLANGKYVFGDVGFSGREMHDIKFSAADKLKLKTILAARRLYNSDVHKLDQGAILASKRGQCSQPAHTDYHVTADELETEILRQETDEGVTVSEKELQQSRRWYDDGGFKQNDVPCSIIVAVTERLLVFNTARKFEAVHLSPGDVLCFRGDAVHAGAGNYRAFSWAWFFYMDLKSLYRPMNSTVLVRLPRDELAQQKLAELCARDSSLFILRRKGKKTPINTIRAVKEAYSLTISDKEAGDRLQILFDASALLCRLGGPTLPTIEVDADKYLQLDINKTFVMDLTFLVPKTSPKFKVLMELLNDAIDRQIRQCFIHCVDHYWFAEIIVGGRSRGSKIRLKITSVPADGACAVRSMALALQSLHSADLSHVSTATEKTVLPLCSSLLGKTVHVNVDDPESQQAIDELTEVLKRSVSPEYFVQAFAEALADECLAAKQFIEGRPSLQDIGAFFGATIKQRCMHLPWSKVAKVLSKHIASDGFAVKRTQTVDGVTTFACFLKANSIVANELHAPRVPFWELANVVWSDEEVYKTIRPSSRSETVIIYDKDEKLDFELVREQLLTRMGCEATASTTLSASDRNFCLQEGRLFVAAEHLSLCAKQHRNLFEGGEDTCFSISLQGRDVAQIYRQLATILFPNFGPRAYTFCRNHTFVLGERLFVPLEGTLNAFACRQHPDGHDVSLQKGGVMVHVNPQRSAADVLCIGQVAFVELRLRAIPAYRTYLPKFQSRNRLKSIYVGTDPGETLWYNEPSFKILDAPWAQITVTEYTGREVLAALAADSRERWNLIRPGTLSVDISYGASKTVRCTCVRAYQGSATETWTCTLPLPSGAVQGVDVAAHSPLPLMHFREVDIAQVSAAFPRRSEARIVKLVGLSFPASLPHTKIRSRDKRALQETLTTTLRRWLRGHGAMVTALWSAQRAACNESVPQLPCNIWKTIFNLARPRFDQLMTCDCIETGTLLLRQNTAQLPVLDYFGQSAKSAAWVAVWPAHIAAKLECTENGSGGQHARAHALLLPANKAYTVQSTESDTICAALFAQRAFSSCFGTDADKRVFRRPPGRPRSSALS